MKTLHKRCAGLDVHKAEVVACLRIITNRKVGREVRRFPTTTQGLLTLAEWLESAGCTHVAMEATGVYWKPVWHILEGHFVLILANAAHVKSVPGRKSDVNDATWLADLLVLVASLARPSDNATDLSTEQVDIAGKRLEILRELVPDFTRLAIVANVGNPGAVLEDARARASGQSARPGNRPTRNQAGTRISCRSTTPRR